MLSDVLLRTVTVELDDSLLRDWFTSAECGSVVVVDRCRVVRRQFFSMYCRPFSVNRYWSSVPLSFTVVFFEAVEDIDFPIHDLGSVCHFCLKCFLS